MALTLFEDTFVLLTEADAKLSGDTAWSEASTAEKEQALRDATFALDDNQWVGFAKSESQPLSWPRTKLNYFDKKLNLLVEIPDSQVPERLEQAVCNLALHYIRYPSAISGYDPEFDKIKLGPLEVDNTDAQSNKTQPPRIPYATVIKLIEPLLFAPMGRGAWWRAN